jgi:hypothetical protein
MIKMDAVSLVISVISICLVVGSAAFTLVTYIRTVRHDRKQATLEAFNRLQAEVFDPLNKIQPKEIAELAQHPRSEDYKTVSGYLARLEHFCVGVRQNIYDKKTVYELAHGYLDGNVIKRRIEPFLEQKNKHTEENEEYYANTRAVLRWMDQETVKRKHN